MSTLEEFFLYFGDLPLHPLAVHFAVVLFPVTALLVALAAMWPSFRKRYLGISTLGLVLTIPFVFIAQQSGEALGEVTYEPDLHEEFGEKMVPVALATAAIAVLFWFAIRSGWSKKLTGVIGFLAVAAAIGASAMTFVVGHSGAEAVWSNKIAGSVSTNGMGETSNEQPEFSGSESITIADVQAHDSAADCWVAIGGSVYALDSFIAEHPGGAASIQNLCGTDATAAFSNQHAQESLPAKQLYSLFVGNLAPLNSDVNPIGEDQSQGASQASNELILQDQVLAHATLADCWVVIAGDVFDLSGYGDQHPGGSAKIAPLCGVDATSAFSSQHGFAGAPADTLVSMKIGTIDATDQLPTSDLVYGEGDDDVDENEGDHD